MSLGCEKHITTFAFHGAQIGLIYIRHFEQIQMHDLEELQDQLIDPLHVNKFKCVT